MYDLRTHWRNNYGLRIATGKKFHGCVLSCVRSFAILWTVAHHAPLSMGFSRQEYWSGLPCSPSGDLPNPGKECTSLTSALAGGFFTTSTTWKIPWTQISTEALKVFLDYINFTFFVQTWDNSPIWVLTLQHDIHFRPNAYYKANPLLQ